MSIFITREMLRQAANEWPRKEAVGILERLVRSAKRNRRRNKTVAELSALSDRELRDIGLYRGDIPRVVHQFDDHDLGLVPATSRTECRPQARGPAVPA